MALQGGRELKDRLKALRGVFKPMGRDWADAVAAEARRRVPFRSGNLRRSIRRKNATQRKATVVAHYSAFFVDAGTKAHVIRPKRARGLIFEAGGRTIFAKKVDHPRVRARPFRASAAREGLRDRDVSGALLNAWNEGA